MAELEKVTVEKGGQKLNVNKSELGQWEKDGWKAEGAKAPAKRGRKPKAKEEPEED